MKVVIFAYTNFGFQCVRYLYEQQEHNFLVVPAPQDIGKPINGWLSIVEYCLKNHIPMAKTDEVSKFSPDVIFSCYYPSIIPKKILDLARFGGLNFHGGILPAYRGCLSGMWAIINDEKETGITLHYMTMEIDKGDIVKIKKVAILPTDTAFSLYEKVRENAFDLFKDILPRVSNLPCYPQEGVGKYYNRSLPHNGHISWDWNTDYICRFVRAMNFPPFKPAQGVVNGKVIHIDQCIPINDKTSKLVIDTADGAIEVTQYNWEDENKITQNEEK